MNMTAELNRPADAAAARVQQEPANIPTELLKLAEADPENFLEQLTWSTDTGLDDFCAFAQANRKNQTIFYNQLWVSTWVRKMAEPRDVSVRFVTGAFAGTPLIALPLAVVSNRLVTRLQFAAQEVSDYNQPVFDEALGAIPSPVMLDALCGKIIALFPQVDCIDFRKCLLTGTDLSQSRYGWLAESEQTHLSHLDPDWKANESRYVGKSSKRSLKRKLAKLQTFGELEFRESQTQDEKRTAANCLCDWKAKQLENLGSASIFQDEAFCAFLKGVVADDRGPDVRLFGMYIDDQPVAIIKILCAGDKWFLYQTAYTSDTPGKYSPGYLLLLHVLEQACGEGIKVFDFGFGNEPYKYRFADCSLPLHHVFIPLTLKGRIAKFASRSLMRAKETAKNSDTLRKVALFVLRHTARRKSDA